MCILKRGIVDWSVGWLVGQSVGWLVESPLNGWILTSCLGIQVIWDIKGWHFSKCSWNCEFPTDSVSEHHLYRDRVTELSVPTPITVVLFKCRYFIGCFAHFLNVLFNNVEGCGFFFYSWNMHHSFILYSVV